MAQFGRSSLINTAHSPGENESMLKRRIVSEKKRGQAILLGEEKVNRIHFMARDEDLVHLVSST